VERTLQETILELSSLMDEEEEGRNAGAVAPAGGGSGRTMTPLDLLVRALQSAARGAVDTDYDDDDGDGGGGRGVGAYVPPRGLASPVEIPDEDEFDGVPHTISGTAANAANALRRQASGLTNRHHRTRPFVRSRLL
jgi:hypothetical protein